MSDLWIVMTLLFSLVSLLLFVRLHRTRGRTPEIAAATRLTTMVTSAVEEHNAEAARLSKSLEKLQKLEDPLEALVNTVRNVER